MGSWARLFAVALAAAWLLPIHPAAANDPTTSPQQAAAPAMSRAVAQAVGDLGSNSFAVREQAGHKLIELGIAAHEALLAAASDSDPEVRVRARAVLATILDADFRNRLEAFSADYDGRLKRTLPGWEPFAAQFGGGTLARQLFVEMQRAEPELLDAMANGDKSAGAALEARCRAIIQQAVQNPPDGQLKLGTVASFLLVGASEAVTVDEQVGSYWFPWMIGQPVFQKDARESNRSAMLKKLLGMWVLKEAGPTTSTENLKMAAWFDLKTEGLSLATRLLNDEQAAAIAKANAMLVVGRFGAQEHLAMIEKRLQDKTNCGALGATAPPRQAELQVRDVALAIAVRLTGQNLRDYGFLSVQPHPTTLFQVGTLSFASSAVRDAALRKWSRWRAEHPG